MIEMPLVPHWLQVTSDGFPKQAVPFVASRITLISIGTDQGISTGGTSALHWAILPNVGIGTLGNSARLAHNIQRMSAPKHLTVNLDIVYDYTRPIA